MSSLGRLVGATGFEPATSRSQSGRSSQAELRPESLTQLVDSPARARRSMRQRGWTPESLLHRLDARLRTPGRRAGCRRRPSPAATAGMTPERALWMICRHADPAWQSVRMTDRTSPVGGPAPRRWPADPTQLVDTTRCPACFSTLSATRCARVRARSRRARGRRAAPALHGALPGRARASGAHRAHARGAGGARGVGRAPGDERAGRVGRRGAGHGDGDTGRCRRAGGIRHRTDTARSAHGCRPHPGAASPDAAAAAAVAVPHRRPPPSRLPRLLRWSRPAPPPASAGAAAPACRSSCSRSAWCSSPSPRSCSSSSPTWSRASRCAR